MSRDMNQTANDCPDCGEELKVNDDPDHAPAATFECPGCGGRFVGRNADGGYVVEGRA
jgi:predicted RNA-binding Zn-ribbon protein involved in translation (DUF1610 family)